MQTMLSMCSKIKKKKFMKFLRLPERRMAAGCPWVSGWRRVHQSWSMEVTLQGSTAANPEYGDFLCVSEAGGWQL